MGQYGQPMRIRRRKRRRRRREEGEKEVEEEMRVTITARFEILAELPTKMQLFWDVT